MGGWVGGWVGYLGEPFLLLLLLQKFFPKGQAGLLLALELVLAGLWVGRWVGGWIHSWVGGEEKDQTDA